MLEHSPILNVVSGAVATPEGHHSPGVAWHYGDPLGEQRAAVRGAAIVDRSDRGVIQVAGDERLSWLHTITSQHVSELGDRRSAENAVLDGNGRIEHQFTLSDVDEITWLDTEGSHEEALLKYLSGMVFWAKAEPFDAPDMVVVTLLGPDVRHGLIAHLLNIPSDAAVYTAGDLPELHDDAEPLGFWRVMPPIGEHGGVPVVDLVIPSSELVYRWNTLVESGAVPAGAWAFDALRVAALRARLGVDTDERAIPHEVDWVGGPDEYGSVHLDKGCYRGQETVARVANLGRPPRRLVLLHLDGSAGFRPEAGDPVSAAGRTVGRVGSVAEHFEAGPVALALVKRNIPVDADLVVGDATDPEASLAARIDPDLYTVDDAVPAGRAAVERLRRGR